MRFVGDRVAFVVAETLAQARDAAELVEVDYEPLPAVVSLEDAAKEGAPKVWDDNPQGNVGFRLMFGNKEATDAAFAKAKHVVKLRVENNRLAPSRDGAARRDRRLQRGRGPLHALHHHRRIRTARAWRCRHVFHVPENQIRVVSPDVGGGFGLKGGPFPDDALVLWASRQLGRPVKWVATRSREHADRPPRPRDGLLRRDGARRERQDPRRCAPAACSSVGAYFVGAALAAGAFSVRFIPEAYDIQTMHIMSQGLFTNTSQAGPYRGAGRPEAAYFTERLIEHAAHTDRHRSGRDPAAQPDPAGQAARTRRRPCGPTTAASSSG